MEGEQTRKGLTKIGGLFLKPCGRAAQVSCWDWEVSGSVQVKLKRGYEEGCKRIVKKAFL